MLLLEFEENIIYGLNIVKYRNIEDENWYYLYIDIETLNLLLTNFGIIYTKKIPTQNICIDNMTTSKNITIEFCRARINMRCGKNTQIYLPLLEQNY